MDSLPVPPFESELKKQQKVYSSKAAPPTGPLVPPVEGTSVMPRQRPKGAGATPLNLNTLTLSPSPTTTITVKKSQSPLTANFQITTTPEKNPQQQLFQASQQNPQQQIFQQEQEQVQLDSLFQSTIYPDPFRDDSVQLSPGENRKDTPPENQLFGSGSLVGNEIRGESGGTPPATTPNLAVPKGHRRNMSESTASNK